MAAGIGYPTRHSDQGGWCPPHALTRHGGTVPAGRPLPPSRCSPRWWPLVSAVSSIAMATAPAASAANWAPVHAGDFPDPSILHWNGAYYGFATQNFAAASQTINIQESTSPDGVQLDPARARTRCPNSSGLGQTGQHVGARASPTTRPTTSSCTTRPQRRPRGRPVHRGRHRSAQPTGPVHGHLVRAGRLPERRRLSAAPSTTGTTAGASTRTSSPITSTGQLVADLEERRQPHRH